MLQKITMSNPLQLREKKEVPTPRQDAGGAGFRPEGFEKKPTKWLRFKDWLKTPKGKVYFALMLLSVLVLVSAGYVGYVRYFQKEKLPWENKNILPAIHITETPEIKKTASSLDGLKYPEDTANRHPLGVMVENHPDARPQSGLDKAKIIYEAISEGGITRFLAIFGPESAPKTGPVRSARTFYLDWCLEYDCFYGHVGGNLDALQLIPTVGVKDLDQFRYGTQAYWREPQIGKATEHTMYTDTDKLWKIAQDNGWDMKANFDSYEFKEDAVKEQRPELASVTIDFSTESYKVKWIYDRESNSYKRELAGMPHKDAISGEQLSAKNVIVQEVQRWYAPTEINETGWAMKTVGSGKAKVFMDGKMYEGTWKKTDRDGRTRFYGTDDKELKFNPGNTWVEIVHSDTTVISQ